ncbi:hypothetical protein ACFWWC_43565 [Streptomyces sp. NPDC058642]|uniref:hypothetical protein n=1 Tax=Streptomyces sp. NPDC058642 TaxID=3346572 RepID=UPI0036636531
MAPEQTRYHPEWRSALTAEREDRVRPATAGARTDDERTWPETAALRGEADPLESAGHISGLWEPRR